MRRDWEGVLCDQRMLYTRVRSLPKEEGKERKGREPAGGEKRWNGMEREGK